MNIARNHLAPDTGDAQGRAGDEFVDLQFPADLTHIDWQALRSRLFASRDTLAVMTADSAASRLHLRGSFDGYAATRLTTFQASLKPVNLDDSSNGKPVAATNSTAADVNGNGERG
ncbi:hypothetical protein [Novosphingobium sp. P6W]|uniref:hypothetical protein n=1 Tax=Novosphingobium sp. P6W TaxID=1609758 RepID=UPI0005C2EF38|nr:hypothetical protein [Novosphingobium sp. P6W]AXB75241.1 hypothetical protein TQ38_000950 [Novosphingobium sp. P6W]KIS32704.1 hypothetical protein TQ38_10460 [Novosphingobium sp. P6W]